MELRYRKHAKLLIVAMVGALMIYSSYFILIYDPLKHIIEMMVTLSPGSLAYGLWSHPPYDILNKFYIFNVSNPEAFLRGEEKLRFNEIGPYVYKEGLMNTKTHFNDNGTVTFMPIRMLQLERDRSIGDPKVDRIIIPNIPLIGITASLKDSSFFVKMAVSSISSYLDSKLFLNVSVYDYLWGYDDPLVELANTVVPNWIDFPRFGIVDRLMSVDNGSNVVTINVDPGVKMSDNELLSVEERSRPYTIQRWNGSPGLPEWGYVEPKGNETVPGNTRCNLLEGSYEGTIFPRNLPRNTTLRLFRKAFCRPLPFAYDGEETSKEGFKAYRYRVSKNFLESGYKNPDNACYCKNGECLQDGLGDLTPCYYDIPIAMSQPHFYNGDPQLLEQIDGIYPDQEKHDSWMNVHPDMGVPLGGYLRAQLNLRATDVKSNHRTKPVDGLTLPLFWVELTVAKLPPQIHLYIQTLYHILPVVQEILKYSLLIIGMVLLFGPAIVTVYSPKPKFQDPFLKNVKYSAIQIMPMRQQSCLKGESSETEKCIESSENDRLEDLCYGSEVAA